MGFMTKTALPTTEQAPRTAWDKVITSTPVLMTIVATLLAGLSSSEMTLSQYHRSLAAQNQSKAGDQWNFFQAKRIRGTEKQIAVEQARARGQAAPLDKASLIEAVDRVPALYRRTLDQGRLLAEALTPANTNVQLAPTYAPLTAAVAALIRNATAQEKDAQQAIAECRNLLAADQHKQALMYLDGRSLPPVEPTKLDDPSVLDGLKAVRERQSEAESAPIVAGINQAALEQAIRTAEANAKSAEDADKPVSAAFEPLAAQLRKLGEAASLLQRAAHGVRYCLSEVPTAERDKLPSVSTAAAALENTADNLRIAVTELTTDFQGARDDYDARRYTREARANQESAGLYELQVRRSGLTSERHRSRSKNFFYGMLAAQAAVTIASLSLAVRNRSVLWGLAGVTGLGAVIFGGYVYLYM